MGCGSLGMVREGPIQEDIQCKRAAQCKMLEPLQDVESICVKYGWHRELEPEQSEEDSMQRGVDSKPK